MFVAEVTTQAWDEGLRSGSLERLCKLITDPDLNTDFSSTQGD